MSTSPLPPTRFDPKQDFIPLPANTQTAHVPAKNPDFMPDPTSTPAPREDTASPKPGYFERAWEWINTPPEFMEKDLLSKARAETSRHEYETEYEIRAGHPTRAGLMAFGTGIDKDIDELGRSSLSKVSLALAAASAAETAYGSLFRVGQKAATLPRVARIPLRAGQTGAAAIFGAQGARTALTPRQEGETGLEEFHRRTMGASGALFGAAGTYANVKDSIRTFTRNRLKLSDNLSEKVAANLDKIAKAREVEAKQTQAAQQELSQKQREIESKKTQAVNAATGILAENMAALEGQQIARMGNIEKSIAEEQVSLEKQMGDLDKEKMEAGRQVLTDTAHSLFQEHARVQLPFIEIGNEITAPVTDSTSVRAIIKESLLEHGVKETELPASATAALGKPTAAETSITWFGEKVPLTSLSPKVVETLKAQGMAGGEDVSFNDLSRVKDDLYRSAQKATDGALKASLYSAAEKVSDMQEKAVEQSDKSGNLAKKYRQAKTDYMRFMRGIGSPMVLDWLSAKDVEEQALGPKLAKLTTPANGEALRIVFKAMGIDTAEWEKTLAEMKRAKGRLRQLPKEKTAAIKAGEEGASKQAAFERGKTAEELQRARATAKQETKPVVAEAKEKIAGAKEEAGKQVTAAEAKGEIVSGKTTSELGGLSNENILRMKLDEMWKQQRTEGVQHPGALVMMVYGLLELARGKMYGAFALSYGLGREAVPELPRSKAFQDWVIREAGIEPSNKLLIFRLRRGLASLYPILREAARSGRPAVVISGSQRQKTTPKPLESLPMSDEPPTREDFRGVSP